MVRPRFSAPAFSGIDATAFVAVLVLILCTSSTPPTSPASSTGANPPPARITLARQDVAADHVSLEWSVVFAYESAASVERATPGTPWRAVGQAAPDEDRLTFTDRTADPGTRAGYRLVLRTRPAVVGPEVWVDVPGNPNLRVRLARAVQSGLSFVRRTQVATALGVRALRSHGHLMFPAGGS